MKFLPFDRMWEKVEIQQQTGDDTEFYSLMYLGQFMCKLLVAGMISAVREDRKRQQYRLKYELVRADSLGSWAEALDTILSGVSAQYLISPTHDRELRELTERTSEGHWQHDSVELLDTCLKLFEPETEKLPTKISARVWINRFTALRNRTQGHGAPAVAKLIKASSHLRESISLFSENFSLFQRGWAFITQTQKGKYKVVKWNPEVTSMDFLKTREGMSISLPEGLYIHFEEEDYFAKVDLIETDLDAEDILLPNGNFNGKTYEVLSYITDKTRRLDAAAYNMPVGQLPPSETQGLGEIEQRGNSIVNLPSEQAGYISRRTPEERLYEEIVNDNQHRIITLVGRGGIGKTWLTLQVLNRIAEEGHFAAILWFSARDLELLPDGAKQVQPHVLSEREVAREFKILIGPYLYSYDRLNSKDFDDLVFLQQNMTNSALGSILFVFDNFETVNRPVDLYNWLDNYLRLPNKVVITTRFRDFKGDYPIELRGMSREECGQLILSTSQRLSILHLLSDAYIEEIYSESDGHPYIVKILLGEVRKAGRATRLERVLASQDNILDVLFERTYSRLSTASQRIFLTLCSWKSVIPRLAIEAVMLKPDDELSNPDQAVEDLINSSLIETSISDADDEVFLHVPLIAAKFGQRKLEVSRFKVAIQADSELLQFFGAAQERDVKQGIRPRVHRLVRNIEERVSKQKNSLDEFLPVLEFVARKYHPTFLMIADLCEKLTQFDRAEEMLARYLEFARSDIERQTGWRRRVRFYAAHGQFDDEIFARLELVDVWGIEYDFISETANRFNNLMLNFSLQIKDYEKRHIIDKLIDKLTERIDEASATDCSRLAWLHMHRNETEVALGIAYRGLNEDPSNEHCNNLIRRLQGGS